MGERNVDLTNFSRNIDQPGTHPFNAGLPRLGGTGHRGLCLEPLNPSLQPCYLGVLVLSLLEPLFVSSLPVREVEREVPTIRLDAAITRGEHRGDGRVQQWQVMAHQQDPSRIVRQVPDKPVLCVEVEVVRRLVQDQRVGFREKQPGEFYTPSLATRHRCNRLVELTDPDPQAGSESFRLSLCDVSTSCGELIVETGKTVDEFVSFGVGGNLHRRAGSFHLPLDVTDLASGQYAFQSCLISVSVDVDLLGQIPDRSRARNRTDRRLRTTGKDPHKGCLARTVWPDETYLVPWLYRKRHIGQERARSCRDGHVSHEQHEQNFRVGAHERYRTGRVQLR